jgi:hypothetical protein
MSTANALTDLTQRFLEPQNSTHRLYEALIQIGAHDIEVRFQKRAHNPYLLAADFDKTDQAIPWLRKKRLRLVFG